MLKLKKLQILGFKSFCDRTEMKFDGEGVTAIVGPNGCGKSNIADAISWVLGEQSAKTLRGSRMEDVIFAGTRDRKPNGMAEVSLTLIDPEVYEGPLTDLAAEVEVEVRDELPCDDWDEAALRARAAEETETFTRQLQPGQAREEDDPEVGADLDGSAPPEVVLKVRRRRLKKLETRAGQIVVTRRLFRSGDSEYLINGKLARLRDIQDIFLGTGLGPESYAIIEQGRIGQILSSKPHDRRAILEEAAGITKFKTKKRLAEARLEQAQQNLARVNDIFEEVTRQMNSLKRQASKAERYVRLREEMRARLRVVLASKLAQFAQETAARGAELETIAAEMNATAAVVDRLENEHTALTERSYAVDRETAQARERAGAIALEIDRALAQQSHNRERCADLEQRAVQAEAELAPTMANLAALETERDSNRAILESAEDHALAAQQEAAACQQEALAAAAALADLEQLQEQRRARTLETIAAASEVRNQMAQASEHRAALERELGRLEQDLAITRTDLDAFAARRGQLALEFESAGARVAALTLKADESRRRLEELRAAEIGTKSRLDGLRAEFAAATGRRSSLEAVINEHTYSTESVKRLMRSGGTSDFRPVGVLADFLEVDDAHERVVEDFLRDELNYIVVKSWDAADEGLRLLRSDVDGRATFLVHPDDAQARFSFAVDEATRPAPPRGSIVPLTRCIRVLNGFGNSLEVILPKLRDGYIAPDPAAARSLALENPNAFFLSPAGECFHNVTVTGGKPSAQGPLTLKRELRELERQLRHMEKEIAQEERRLAELTREAASLASLLDRLEEERREAERQALTSGHTLQQVDSEVARLTERRATYEAERNRCLSEISGVATQLAARSKELETAEARRSLLERQLAEAQTQLESLKAARDRSAQAAGEMAVRVAGLEERRVAAAASVGRIEALVAEMATRVEGLRAQIASGLAERRQREAENVELAARVQALEAEREELAAREAVWRTEAEQSRARLLAIDQELRAARHTLDAARDRRGEVSALLAKLNSDTEHLAETCLNELGVSAADLRADTALVRLSGEALAAEDAAHRELRARLEAMGPVNMMALDEYKETAERHAFLESQRKDLLESIANTQNTIREIDEFSRQRFQEAFERINENFQMTFRKLFGGGQGFMRLTDEENAAESGIDIVAQPPGKRLQNVLLLSGGEKALTAFALLVGIFQYQPSPFCVLDEVDAPLDEANVGRFTELVREMSAQTQFVIITHNKRTMDMAPTMYGVTMQEPGVSKLVSVKFGDHLVHSRTA
ncbi:MAG TPA: chromosome segregation protein SMC [Terriglobales bacterium]|nr:chromosome segregation protein SMC [Terriglobales bacterium]